MEGDFTKYTKIKNLHTVKNNFYTEKYVKKHICKRERSLFTQLPVGILPIEFETGRYRGIAIV